MGNPKAVRMPLVVEETHMVVAFTSPSLVLGTATGALWETALDMLLKYEYEPSRFLKTPIFSAVFDMSAGALETSFTRSLSSSSTSGVFLFARNIFPIVAH